MPDPFPATQWSLIRRASATDPEVAKEALEVICTRYWRPVYAYVRRSGKARPDAEDITQEFFAAVLERGVLEGADPSRGKLRSLLLACLKNFLRDHHKHASAQKRSPATPVLSLDFSTAEREYQLEPADEETPETLFERRWVATLLHHVLERLEAAFTKKHSAESFAVVREFLPWNGAETSYADAALKLGTSEGALKVQVHRLRARYRELLRSEIAQTLEDTDPEVLDREIASLFSIASV